jgi:peroxiredoxin
MMKKLIFFSLIVLVSLAVLNQTGCAQEKKELTSTAGVEAGTKALDFTLDDVRGRATSLKDFEGRKVVFLVFSATWCPACNREIPELIKLQNEYGPKGLEIVDIYIQESQKKISSFVEKNRINYTILLDLDGSVARQYKVHGIPTLMVIDKESVIRERGYPPSSRFVSLIEELLGE